MRRSRRRLLAAAAGIASTFLVPAATQAAYYGSETDYATPSGGPAGNYNCSTYTGVTACFKPDGDLMYVKDTKADGYDAVLEWFDADGERTGSCVNELSAGHWGVCDKNLPGGHLMYYDPARYLGGNLVHRKPYVAWNMT